MCNEIKTRTWFKRCTSHAQYLNFGLTITIMFAVSSNIVELNSVIFFFKARDRSFFSASLQGKLIKIKFGSFEGRV